MAITEIRPDIRYVGVNDRTTTRFEGLWPLPQGVSYNSYLVVGEKIALVDTVEERFGGRLLENIRHQIGDRAVDYLVVNHMEPDHSSSIALLRRHYPALQIVGNAKTLQMVEGYYGIAGPAVTVADGAQLDLGGLTLQFHLIPMVHWPETMATWCPERQTLFAGDAFGSFGALDGGITDSQVETERYWDEMRRYYAAIVGKYGAPVQKALAKLGGLPIHTICPTHGPVWQREVARVVALYDRMSRYEAEPGVVIAYGSMYGNTERLAERIARTLCDEGAGPVRVYNLSYAEPSEVLRDIFRYDTLVVGGPTYNGALFPPVQQLLDLVAARAIPRRRFAAFGSFTWAGATARRFEEFAAAMKWECAAAPFETKQGVGPDDLERCDALARTLAADIKAAGR